MQSSLENLWKILEGSQKKISFEECRNDISKKCGTKNLEGNLGKCKEKQMDEFVYKLTDFLREIMDKDIRGIIMELG